jgi:hypothetical protein
MSAKAYLFVRFDTSKFPPVVVGAETGSGPLTDRTFSGIGHELWVEVCHVKGNTDAQAGEKLIRMVRGKEPCPFGDLRFLWPFLDPNEETHDERYWLGKLIRESLARMTPVATALNYARQMVAARSGPREPHEHDDGAYEEDMRGEGWQ